MSWGFAAWLWALLGVGALMALVALMGRRHASVLSQHFSGAVLERVLPRSVRIRRVIRDVCMLLALVGIVVALAEPRFGKQVVEIERKGIDMVLCLDLSRSMDATDVDPSRLERMRREVYDLVERMPGDRVGMVIYAGGAWPRMPLTRDTDALSLLVRELDTTVFQSQGSELGSAIRKALELLDDPQSAAGKAIVVMSDGEVHRVDDALAAAEQAREKGVRIYGMGIGQEGAPIPLRDGTWLQHEGGTVISTPSHGVLKDVARITGGAYVDSVASSSDIEQLYDQEIRGTLEAVQTGILQREVWNSGFQWPLGFAVFLLLVGSWIGDGRRRAFGGLAVALLALSLGAPVEALADDKVDADAAYRGGEYSKAIDILEQLAAENPADSDVYGRLGAARYRTGDFDGAARAFETQSRLLQGDSTEADYNAGNAHYRAGRLEKALENYEKVLDKRPNHQRATGNRDVVADELAKRRQKQQEQQEQNQGEGGQAPEEGGDQTEQQQQQQSAGEEQGDEQESSDQQQGQGEQGEGERDDPSGQPESSEDKQGGGENTDDSSETVGLDELESKEEGDEGDEGDGTSDQPAEEGAMTPEQAERLLEGVEEGTPRIQVQGEKGGKPW